MVGVPPPSGPASNVLSWRSRMHVAPRFARPKTGLSGPSHCDLFAVLTNYLA
jgi:hypothetical protein